MKYDEFAFFNQQLGRMLKDGIPLEGALKRLCTNMRRSKTRAELEALGRDLADGRPLDQALAGRRLPDLYVRLLKMGARSNNLPDLLLMLADHYRRVSFLWTRLKGLLVYPVLVLVVALGVSIHIASVLYEVRSDYAALYMDMRVQTSAVFRLIPYKLLFPPVTLGLLLLLLLACITLPALRRRLRWRLPAFKDAALARTASALALMLRGGATLDGAIDMAREMEGKSPAARELAEWKARLAEGRTSFADIALAGSRFPKLFVWLVNSAGEDMIGGFAHAAEIYQERAWHRAEMALYGLLPACILMLGLMIYLQAYMIMGVLADLMSLMQNLGQG